jgi:hypothetical protein
MKPVDTGYKSAYSAFMSKLKPIMLLLAFALLIQNTCPYNAAGKSSVTGACGNCPLKHTFTVASDAAKNLVNDASSVHYPLYVFSVPKTVHTFSLDPVKSVKPVLADRYKDALPDELLRPPRA